MRPSINALVGLKVRIAEGINPGLAYQLPITSNKECASQMIGLSEFGWTMRREGGAAVFGRRDGES